jgi:predicted TIM-barrel fold metal-dependent hydrolase
MRTNEDTRARWIDVHHHVLPPPYLAALEHAGIADPIPGVDWPAQDTEATLAMMDRQGIATAIVSISDPGVLFGDLALARKLARTVNEFTAGLVADHPQRFGAFAVLPLPDVDAALHEVAYALDTLKLDGIGLLTHYRGVYLGDETFEPLLAELHRRQTVAFVHPSTPPSIDQPMFGLPPSLYEFPFETTRTVANLLYSGTLDRYPDLRLILSHAGGAVPYLAKRLTFGPIIRAALKGRAPRNAVASLRRLYYDLAMAATPFSLPSLHALVDPSHILFGSDYPFVPETDNAENVAGLTSYDGFDRQARRLIEYENALTLFPRLRLEQGIPA